MVGLKNSVQLEGVFILVKVVLMGKDLHEQQQTPTLYKTQLCSIGRQGS